MPVSVRAAERFTGRLQAYARRVYCLGYAAATSNVCATRKGAFGVPWCSAMETAAAFGRGCVETPVLRPEGRGGSASRAGQEGVRAAGNEQELLNCR